MGIGRDSSEDFCLSSYCNFWNTDAENNEGLVDSAVHGCSIRNRTKIHKMMKSCIEVDVLCEGGLQELNLDNNLFRLHRMEV